MGFYEDFSRVYDEVMDQTLYAQWLAFTQRHLPSETRSIFELACGSGALAVELSLLGYEVTGLDISEEMLALAAKKAADAGQRIDFILGDMRQLQGLGTYDAVTCYSDSLCYLADLNEVKQATAGVYEQLRAGGRFIFDVHSIHQIDDVFPDFSYHENEEDFAFLWDSFVGNAPHSIEHQLTFFIKDKDGKFIRKDELHEERTYELREYLSALQRFSEVEVYADFTDEGPVQTSRRWFFVAKK